MQRVRRRCGVSLKNRGYQGGAGLCSLLRDFSYLGSGRGHTSRYIGDSLFARRCDECDGRGSLVREN